MSAPDFSGEQISYYPDINSDFDQEPESFFADLNNDGTLESRLQGIDTDNNGQLDSWAIESDINGDRITDQTSLIQEIDTDSDGLADTLVMQADLDGGVIDVAADAVNEAGVGDSSNNFSNSCEAIGNPEIDLQYWEWQGNDMTCAIKSQEFILDQLGGKDFSQEELVDLATQNGWYTPGVGTPWEHVGSLLEVHGVAVERVNHEDSSVAWEDLQQKLANGQKALVGVDADEIWNSNGNDDDDRLTNSWGIPGGGANHVVQVIGIENPSSDNPIVILNDPGTPEGKGLRVPASLFIDAWQDSGQYMVSTVSTPTVA